MRIKKTNKNEVDKWLKTNEITKVSPNKRSNDPWMHVSYSGSGLWSSKNLPRREKKKHKKQRLADQKRRRERYKIAEKSKQRYSARIQSFKSKELDRQLKTAIEKDKS